MHKVLLIILTLLLSKNSFSQNYVEVYRFGILGAMYMEQGRPDSAEKYLRKALELMPDKTNFPHYFNLIKIADKHSDTKKLTEYFKELSCIYPKDTIFKYLKDYSEISMDIATFNKLYHPKCRLSEEKKNSLLHPKAVDSIIAVLRDRDQGVRNKVNKKQGKRSEDELSALEKEMHDIDSTNFLILFDCIKKYGIPRMDFPLAGSRVTLLMHIDNYENFKKIDSYLLKAIKEGCLSPADYAYALDRSLAASGLLPKYYWFIPESSFQEKYKPQQNEISVINNDRKLIGLPQYPMWTGWGF